MKKYGLLTYETPNIGDDIQSIAASQFLPQIDYYVSRDRISKFRSNTDVYVIMNGWFMHKPYSHGKPENKMEKISYILQKKLWNNSCFWPPAKQIKPLFVAFHVTKNEDEHKSLMAPRLRNYYKEHAPIGCRDHSTHEGFKKLGVESYFSGCLTLTLQNQNLPKTNDICFVDPFGPLDGTYYFPMPDDPKFPHDLWEQFPSEIRKTAKYITHFTTERDPKKRIAQARKLVETYSTAKLVITSRLHCALPCLALGTPVIFIPMSLAAERYEGLTDLFDVYTLDQIRKGEFDINWENPAKNLKDIKPIADKIRKTCKEFIQ